MTALSPALILQLRRGPSASFLGKAGSTGKQLIVMNYGTNLAGVWLLMLLFFHSPVDKGGRCQPHRAVCLRSNWEVQGWWRGQGTEERVTTIVFPHYLQFKRNFWSVLYVVGLDWIITVEISGRMFLLTNSLLLIFILFSTYFYTTHFYTIYNHLLLWLRVRNRGRSQGWATDWIRPKVAAIRLKLQRNTPYQYCLLLVSVWLQAV